MSAGRTTSGRMRHGWMAVLLIALAVRALVPSGWMPSASGIGLSLCNGDAAMPSLAEIARHRGDGVPLQIAVARAMIDRADGGGDSPPTPSPADHHPCAFAGMAPVLAGPALAVVAPPRSIVATPMPAHPAVGIGNGLSAPPPPATGPPHAA